MKKNSIIFFVLCCCLSCTKKEAILAPNVQNAPTANSTNARAEEPVLTDGRWVFNSEKHFEDYVNDLDKLDKDAWEAEKEFVSYRTTYLSGLSESEREDLQEMPINDASLATLLNENAIVQVSPWIFKLNPTNRTVYALHTNYIADIEQLNSETPQGTHIREFSFDDEVFDMVAELTAGKNEAQCAGQQQDGTGINTNGAWESYCTGYKICAKVRYDNFGIMKNLYTEFKHRSTTAGGYDATGFIPSWSYVYVKKNGGSGSDNNLLTTTASYNKNYDCNFYHGTKCLTTFYALVSYTYTNKCTNANSNTRNFEVEQK